MTSYFKPEGRLIHNLRKAAIDGPQIWSAGVASATRRFTRKRGRIICIERHGTNAARGVVECDCGISAAHPITKSEF